MTTVDLRTIKNSDFYEIHLNADQVKTFIQQYIPGINKKVFNDYNEFKQFVINRFLEEIYHSTKQDALNFIKDIRGITKEESIFASQENINNQIINEYIKLIDINSLPEKIQPVQQELQNNPLNNKKSEFKLTNITGETFQNIGLNKKSALKFIREHIPNYQSLNFETEHDRNEYVTQKFFQVINSGILINKPSPINYDFVSDNRQFKPYEFKKYLFTELGISKKDALKKVDNNKLYLNWNDLKSDLEKQLPKRNNIKPTEFASELFQTFNIHKGIALEIINQNPSFFKESYSDWNDLKMSFENYQKIQQYQNAERNFTFEYYEIKNKNFASMIMTPIKGIVQTDNIFLFSK
jgi:hypothetical protein